MKRLLPLVLAAGLLATACSPAQVEDFASDLGINVTRSQAVKVARVVRSTPCMANYAERFGFEATPTMDRCTEIEASARYYFGDRADAALRVGTCESTHNNSAVGAAGEFGWLQIHPGWWRSWGYDDIGRPLVTALGYTANDLHTDPWATSHVASIIQAREGWSPWTCSRVL